MMYGILEFNVPLDTVWVISETRQLELRSLNKSLHEENIT